MKFKILLCLLFITFIFSQIKITGDAMVRPRYDILDRGKFGDSQKDFYYMYRARINLKADIGDGWYFKSQLGHHGYGAFGMTTQNSTKRLANEIEGSSRPSIDFLQLYIAQENEKWGISGGIIPLNSLNNPLFDLHYYPNFMIDVPTFLMGVDAVFGFSGYFNILNNRLTIYALKDKNEIYLESADNTVKNDKNDSYTFGLNYPINIADFIIEPNVLLAAASKKNTAPATFGLNLRTPKVGTFTFNGSIGFSTQKNDETLEYNASFIRIKAVGDIGPGNLTAWFDFATRTDKYKTPFAFDEKHNFNYFWIMYTIPVYKSDKGSVTIAPTIRRLQETSDNKVDMERYKIEISTNIIF